MEIRAHVFDNAEVTASALSRQVGGALDSLVDDTFEKARPQPVSALGVAGEDLLAELVSEGARIWQRALVPGLDSRLREMRQGASAGLLVLDEKHGASDHTASEYLLYRPGFMLPGLTSGPLTRPEVRSRALRHWAESAATWVSFPLGRRLVTSRLHRRADQLVQVTMARAANRLLFAFDHEAQALVISINENLDLRTAARSWVTSQSAAHLPATELQQEAEQLRALARALQAQV